MKVLVTGSAGQLGSELSETAPENVSIMLADRRMLDISNAAEVVRYVRAERPDIVLNAAAYTAVDKAEAEPDKARLINVDGAAHLAAAVNDIGARLVQISTDFVFNGRQSSPYSPESQTDPLSVYGITKRDGEVAVAERLPSNQVLIVRTAWVYSTFGHNFVKTMLRLMNERAELNVVGDQIGTPTWARALAKALWRMLALRLSGIHHWTDAGAASWYDFAAAIYDEGRALKLLTRDVKLQQIRTMDYPTPARRPAYSVLDKTATWQALGEQSAHWRVALREMLQQSMQRAA